MSSSLGRRAADAYLEVLQIGLSTGRYPDMGELFDEHAVFLAPHGEVLEGRAAISEFFNTWLPKMRPKSRYTAILEKDRQCVVELESRNSKTGDWRVEAIDYFTTGEDGKITRLDVFVRGSSRFTEHLLANYGNSREG